MDLDRVRGAGLGPVAWAEPRVGSGVGSETGRESKLGVGPVCELDWAWCERVWAGLVGFGPSGFELVWAGSEWIWVEGAWVCLGLGRDDWVGLGWLNLGLVLNCLNSFSGLIGLVNLDLII